jgi:hypothetical protein
MWTAVLALVSAIIGAVLVGSYEHWRDWYYRPILQIDYAGPDANKVDGDRWKDGKQILEVYIRARIRNIGRLPAKNCLVYLTDLRAVQVSGTTPTSFHDPSPLGWAGWRFTPRDIPRDIPFYVDIMRVSKETPGWLISVQQLFDNQEKLKYYSGTYRFELTATADNAEPVKFSIDVTYAKDWNGLRAVPSKI